MWQIDEQTATWDLLQMSPRCKLVVHKLNEINGCRQESHLHFTPSADDLFSLANPECNVL